jgi:hypothetical protein
VLFSAVGAVWGLVLLYTAIAGFILVLEGLGHDI